MVRIDKVVTKGGDGGETSLGDGSRVSKADARIEAMGAVDEANATIGLLRLHTKDAPAGRRACWLVIQNDLFDVGADLCVPGTAVTGCASPTRPLAALEEEVQQMNELPPLKSFILPGGTAGAAFAHMARVVGAPGGTGGGRRSTRSTRSSSAT